MPFAPDYGLRLLQSGIRDRYLRLSWCLYRWRSELLLTVAIATFAAGIVSAHIWRHDRYVLLLFCWAPTVYALAVTLSGRREAANAIARSPLFLVVSRAEEQKEFPHDWVLRLDKQLIESCAGHGFRRNALYYRAVGKPWQLATAGKELECLLSESSIRDGVVEVTSDDLVDLRRLCDAYITQVRRFYKLLAVCSVLVVGSLFFESWGAAISVFAVLTAGLVATLAWGETETIWLERRPLLRTSSYLPLLTNWHFHVYKQQWNDFRPHEDAELQCECGKILVIGQDDPD